MLITSLQGVPPFTVTTDEFDLVKMMVEEAGETWQSAVPVIKELAAEYGAARACALVVAARQGA